MNKISFFCFILIISSCIITGCGSDSGNIQKENNAYIQGVWVDDTTYRIMAQGSPSRNLTKPDEQMASAVRSATYHARNLVLKKFKEYRKTTALNQQLPKTSKTNAKVVINSIKKGTVVKNSEQFDKKNNCSLVFEVRTSDLRTLVLSSDLDSVDIIR